MVGVIFPPAFIFTLFYMIVCWFIFVILCLFSCLLTVVFFLHLCMGKCLKFYFPTFYDFYLIAVNSLFSVFCNVLQSVCLWSTVAGFFSGQVCCWWLWAWWEMRPGFFQKHYALFGGVLECFQLLRSVV